MIDIIRDQSNVLLFAMTATLASLIFLTTPLNAQDKTGSQIISSPAAASPGPTPTPMSSTLSGSQTDDVQVIDLSEWVKEYSKLGITKFKRGQFFMRSKKNGYYYVLIAPGDYSTEGVNTRVMLKNVTGAGSALGYGLIFHSDPEPLIQDYAFLIDTVRKRYRVVRHEPKKEISVIRWTHSPHIKGGRQVNVIEVRDRGDVTELFINEQLVTSIKNTYAFKNGSPGLYTGVENIAFKDLMIKR